MIEVKMVADSVNVATKDRLTSFLLTYPRYIHSELMTHRVFSRNAASSRAIPVAKFRKDVMENPVMPSHWGANQPGMAADAELDDTLKDWLWPSSEEKVTQREFAKRTWLAARDLALGAHLALEKVGLHKQIANRIIEPWFHIQVLVSSTEWTNWFSLRSSEAAHPDIMNLSDAMLETYVLNEDHAELKDVGQWHLPFGDQFIPEDMPATEAAKICTSRAARVSYKTFEGEIDFAKDTELHDRLRNSGHWSPFEHAAMATKDSEWSGNFRGWRQYRKLFPNENRVVDLKQLLEARRQARGVDSLLPK